MSVIIQVARSLSLLNRSISDFFSMVPWKLLVVASLSRDIAMHICDLGVVSSAHKHKTDHTVSYLLPLRKKGLSFFLDWDFPCSTVNKNLTAKAGSMDSIPDLGRIHMPWNNRARAPKPAASPEGYLPRACAPQCEKPPQWEAHAPQWRINTPPILLAAAREKPTSSTKTQHSQK